VVFGGDESGSRAAQSQKAGMHQGVGKARRRRWLVLVVPGVHIIVIVPCGGEPRCLERDKPVVAGAVADLEMAAYLWLRRRTLI
jgi:hypothetical protein